MECYNPPVCDNSCHKQRGAELEIYSGSQPLLCRRTFLSYQVRPTGVHTCTTSVSQLVIFTSPILLFQIELNGLYVIRYIFILVSFFFFNQKLNLSFQQGV